MKIAAFQKLERASAFRNFSDSISGAFSNGLRSVILYLPTWRMRPRAVLEESSLFCPECGYTRVIRFEDIFRICGNF